MPLTPLDAVQRSLVPAFSVAAKWSAPTPPLSVTAMVAVAGVFAGVARTTPVARNDAELPLITRSLIAFDVNFTSPVPLSHTRVIVLVTAFVAVRCTRKPNSAHWPSPPATTGCASKKHRPTHPFPLTVSKPVGCIVVVVAGSVVVVDSVDVDVVVGTVVVVVDAVVEVVDAVVDVVDAVVDDDEELDDDEDEDDDEEMDDEEEEEEDEDEELDEVDEPPTTTGTLATVSVGMLQVTEVWIAPFSTTAVVSLNALKVTAPEAGACTSTVIVGVVNVPGTNGPGVPLMNESLAVAMVPRTAVSGVLAGVLGSLVGTMVAVPGFTIDPGMNDPPPCT